MTWNWGNMQSICGVPIIVGDSLYFYSSGRRLNDIMWDSYTSTGLATLRRDGFISRHAGNEARTLTTEPVVFDGKYLFVNAAVKGKLVIDVLDKNGKVIADGFATIENTDATSIPAGKLAKYVGKEVKFRFTMTDGDLYAFWVSPWETGESRGYTAGGGPGLSPSGIDIPIQ